MELSGQFPMIHLWRYVERDFYKVVSALLHIDLLCAVVTVYITSLLFVIFGIIVSVLAVL